MMQLCNFAKLATFKPLWFIKKGLKTIFIRAQKKLYFPDDGNIMIKRIFFTELREKTLEPLCLGDFFSPDNFRLYN